MPLVIPVNLNINITNNEINKAKLTKIAWKFGLVDTRAGLLNLMMQIIITLVA